MSVKPVGSIFNLSYYDIQIIESRLKAYDETNRTQYFDLSEGLLEHGHKDYVEVEIKKVTYQAIANKIKYIYTSAIKALFEANKTAKSTNDFKKNIIIDEKFKVTIINSNFTACCPFSHSSKPEEACGKSQLQFIIENILLKVSIVLDELDIHLIGDHHYFKGIPPYRAEPSILIKILNLEPQKEFSRAFQ